MATDSNPFSKFDPQVSKNVEGLIYLGYLERKIDFCGHTFVLRTLTGEEELLVGLLTKEYTDTLAQAKAWAWAHVALALKSVDGREDFCPPIGPDPAESARGRFKFCTSKWNWALGEYLFAEYAELAQEASTAIQALSNLPQRGLPRSSPSHDSLTEPGTSKEGERTGNLS